MSRTETANRLTVSAVTERIDGWGDQLARLQTMQGDLSSQLESLALQKAATAQDLARALLPLAESMAQLTEETRQTLQRVVSQSQNGHRAAEAAMAESTKAARQVASDLGSAMLKVESQVRELERAAREAREDRPVSPWAPAILAALMPLGAILWLAWKVGAFR